MHTFRFFTTYHADSTHPGSRATDDEGRSYVLQGNEGVTRLYQQDGARLVAICEPHAPSRGAGADGATSRSMYINVSSGWRLADILNRRARAEIIHRFSACKSRVEADATLPPGERFCDIPEGAEYWRDLQAWEVRTRPNP